jgi:tetratricopeptide (TPR) repeat protein
VENVVWHVLLVLGIFALGRRLGLDPGAVFLATALFAVHPLGTQSVAWISGRKDVLCAVFAVAALLAWLRGLEGSTPVRVAAWTALASLAALLAMLCKELALVLPALGAVILAWRWPLLTKGRRWRRACLGLGALAVPAIAVVAWRLAVLGGFGLDATHPTDTFAGNLGTSARLMIWYLGRVLAPGAPMLSDAWRISRELGPVEIGATVLLLGLAVLGLASFARRRAIGFALAWAGVWILPATGILALQHVRAERYLYPASWGVLLAAVLVLRALARKTLGPRGVVAVAIGLFAAVAFAGVATFRAGSVWHDDRTLFTDSTSRDPRHVEGWIGLATTALEEESHEESARHGETALAKIGEGTHAAFWSPLVLHTNLGLAYYHLGPQTRDRALEQFELALAVEPGSATAHYHVGLGRLAEGDAAGAATSFRRCLELRPGDFLARGNLATALLRLRRVDEALALLETLVAERPGNRTNRTNLASALLAAGRHADARRWLEELAEEPPEDAGVLAKLAWCQLEAGERDLALATWLEARAADPAHPTVRFMGRKLRGR